MLWSTLERFAPRVATAGIMLLFAAVSTPEIVGYYAAVLLVFTVVQGWFEGAARVAGVGAVGSVSGERTIRLYQRLFAWIGPIILVSTILALRFFGEVDTATALTLAPVVFVPWTMAVATRAIIGMQHAHKWRELARYQALAVVAASLIGIPCVLVFKNALGSTAQLLVQQALFSLLVIRAAKSLSSPEHVAEETPVSYPKQFLQASVMSIVDWAQGQLDRALIGFFSGAGALGLYNFGWNIARTAPDAAAHGIAYVLRSELQGSEGAASASEARVKVHSTVNRAMVVLIAVIAATWLGAYIVLPAILSEEWGQAVILVPLMCAATIPIAVSQYFVIVLVWEDRIHVGLQARIFGCVLAVAVALASLISLEAAIWAAIAREIAVQMVLWYSTRHIVGGRILLRPMLLTGVLALGGWLIEGAYPWMSSLLTF